MSKNANAFNVNAIEQQYIIYKLLIYQEFTVIVEIPTSDLFEVGFKTVTEGLERIHW